MSMSLFLLPHNRSPMRRWPQLVLHLQERLLPNFQESEVQPSSPRWPIGSQANQLECQENRLSGCLLVNQDNRLPCILKAVNKEAGSQFAFAVTATEDELANIRAAFQQSKEEKTEFEKVIAEKHTITVLLAAVRLHRADRAHKSVKKPNQDCSFIGTPAQAC
jgi:hypothetical protein